MKQPNTIRIEKLIGKKPLSTIAKMFGVTYERVRQIKSAMQPRPTRAEVRELYNVDQVLKSVLVERTQNTGWII